MLALFAASALFMAPVASTSAPADTLAPAFGGSGFYVGVNFGYGRGEHDVELLDYNHVSTGILGGPVIGYSHQISNWVLGAEADYAFSGIQSDDTVNAVVLTGSQSTAIQHHKKYVGTVRAHLGYGFERLLPYVAIGMSYGENESSTVAKISGLTGAYSSMNGTFSGSQSQVHEGWTVGAGLEVAVAPAVSVGVEYLYMDLSKETYTVLPQLDPTPRSQEITASIFRLSMNYYLGGHD